MLCKISGARNYKIHDKLGIIRYMISVIRYLPNDAFIFLEKMF